LSEVFPFWEHLLELEFDPVCVVQRYDEDQVLRWLRNCGETVSDDVVLRRHCLAPAALVQRLAQQMILMCERDVQVVECMRAKWTETAKNALERGVMAERCQQVCERLAEPKAWWRGLHVASSTISFRNLFYFARLQYKAHLAVCDAVRSGLTRMHNVLILDACREICNMMSHECLRDWERACSRGGLWACSCGGFRTMGSYWTKYWLGRAFLQGGGGDDFKVVRSATALICEEWEAPEVEIRAWVDREMARAWIVERQAAFEQVRTSFCQACVLHVESSRSRVCESIYKDLSEVLRQLQEAIDKLDRMECVWWDTWTASLDRFLQACQLAVVEVLRGEEVLRE
jgi:hypothetical protein